MHFYLKYNAAEFISDSDETEFTYSALRYRPANFVRRLSDELRVVETVPDPQPVNLRIKGSKFDLPLGPDIARQNSTSIFWLISCGNLYSYRLRPRYQRWLLVRLKAFS